MNLNEIEGDRAVQRQIKHDLSNYRLLELVGQGQFGKVFCATERKTGKLVALKELTHRRLPTNKFLRELWSLLTLQHPNIVTCRALEETATARYLVMDYCEGGTLRELLKQENALTVGEGLLLIRWILAGLDSAHEQGIIHCDIKPENILVTLRNGFWFARLSDFGISRRLSELRGNRFGKDDGSMKAMGATAYKAPEGFYGLESPAADIYSMGILLFEMLFGYRPFTGKPSELMWAHLNQPLQVPPVIPQPLSEIVKKALAKLPARRYASAAQMAQAIERAMNDPQVRSLRDRSLPFRVQDTGLGRSGPKLSKAPPIAFAALSHRELLPAPVTELVADDGYLYGAMAKQVRIWQQFQQPAIQVDFPESVTSVESVLDGCLVSTHQLLYWVSKHHWQPEPLLSFENEFRATTDPQNRWLAVACAGQLQIYSSIDYSGQKPHAPQHQCSLPGETLPELMFLDQRHILAVWSDLEQKKPTTQVMVYTRRGKPLGSVQFQVVFDRLILKRESYTLWGIGHLPRPAAWQIHLWPPHVTRIPLNTVPVCLSPVLGGCVIADAEGKVLWLNDEGRCLGSVQGPPAPVAIAAGLDYGWLMPGEKRSLAIATPTYSGGSIHFLNIDFNGNRSVSAF